MKICVTSDTHTYHRDLVFDTNVDTIIHCGDFTKSPLKNNRDETIEFLDWFDSLPIKNKILIAGNHEYFLHRCHKNFSIETFFKENYPNIHYLQDSSIVIDGIKFYGTPWTLRYGDWYFMKDREKDLFEVFSKIDIDTNVLISHSPAEWTLDYTSGMNIGSSALKYQVESRLQQLEYHLFGHVHESYGYKEMKNYIAINSAFLYHEQDNNPFIFDYYTKEIKSH